MLSLRSRSREKTDPGRPKAIVFHSIPPTILERMQYLELLDSRDRQDGTPRLDRLRQIPPETGRFLALLLAGAPAGSVLEIGTSAGYSTLWLSLAGRPITTFEILPRKIALAKETFRTAGIGDKIRLVAGDALEHMQAVEEVGFCFLDAEKEIYASCYEAVVPKLVRGGLLLADNAINHRETLQPILDRALEDERVDAMVVPVGKGLLFCRKI